MMKKCIVCLGGILLAWGLWPVFGLPEASHVALSVAMESGEFTVGEPVAFVLQLDNADGVGEAVILGGYGIGNLRIELSDGRSNRVYAAPLQGGFAPVLCPHPSPGHPFRLGILLDAFTGGGLEPGEYTMTLSVAADNCAAARTPRENAVWVLPRPATASFRVVESTTEAWCGVTERFSRWMKLVAGDSESEWFPSVARKAVLLSHHPLAWAVQEEWLREGDWHGVEEFQCLAESLLESGRAGIVPLMVSAVLEKPQAEPAVRKTLLNILKKYGALDWHDDRAALLAPWMNEIRGASSLYTINCPSAAQ